MMRPRGMPPTPMQASSESEVVEMAGMSITSLSPRRMIEPLPNFFSMFASAASTALPRSAPCLSAMFATTSFSSPFLTLLNLCLNSEDPESLPQTAREWNSVSHLQQVFFHPGGDEAGDPSWSRDNIRQRPLQVERLLRGRLKTRGDRNQWGSNERANSPTRA